MADIITPTYIVMSSIVTVIALISTMRFVYVDNKYSKFIKNLRTTIYDIEKIQLEKDIPNDSAKSDDLQGSEVLLKELYELLGFYKSNKNNNKFQGVLLDFISFGLIIGSALLSINEIINDQSILNTIIIISISTPLLNLVNHLYILGRERKLF